MRLGIYVSMQLFIAHMTNAWKTAYSDEALSKALQEIEAKKVVRIIHVFTKARNQDGEGGS